jgi:uncharacterized protein (DUF1697 family)
MKRWVALLRGVNLAARNRVAMADLRAALHDAGYGDARTLLQSGNVVFSAGGRERDHAARIGAAASAVGGFEVGVLVRSRDQLAALVEADPLGDVATDPARRYVAFLERRPPARTLAAIDADEFLPERFERAGRELAVWLPDGTQRARLTHAFWEKRLGMGVTLRNWNTVRRLLEAADADVPGAG